MDGLSNFKSLRTVIMGGMCVCKRKCFHYKEKNEIINVFHRGISPREKNPSLSVKELK